MNGLVASILPPLEAMLNVIVYSISEVDSIETDRQAGEVSGVKGQRGWEILPVIVVTKYDSIGQKGSSVYHGSNLKIREPVFKFFSNSYVSP